MAEQADQQTESANPQAIGGDSRRVDAPLEVVCFDLYGTLVEIRSRTLYKRVPRLFGVKARAWVELIRERLLVEPLAEVDHFVDAVAEALGTGRQDPRREELANLVRAELDSVELLPGVLSLLHYLKRKGLRLALMSNLTGVHKQPVFDLELAELFDLLLFSCDEGLVKPDPAFYDLLVERIGVDASAILFVGDGIHNDVRGPEAAGMRARLVGREDKGLVDTSSVGWLRFDDPALDSLMPRALEPRLGGRLAIEDSEPVSDSEQGRYNLVRRARVSVPVPQDMTAGVVEDESTASTSTLYLKRYLLPETAHLEAFAHQLAAEVELSPLDAWVLPGEEPILAVTEAPGDPFGGDPEDVDASLAREIGRHLAFAYVFGNADMRPRNAWVERTDTGAKLTMIDLEHCLFNLAIDTEGLDDPFDVAALDAQSEMLMSRVKRRVLSAGAVRRTRRSFIAGELAHRYRAELAEGMVDGWRRFRERAPRLREMLEDRIHTSPPLILGTRSYRRAMAQFDVEDLCSRFDEDPVDVLDRSFERRRVGKKT